MGVARAMAGSVACLAVAALLTGCGAQTCGCGASPDDALAQHDLSFAGDHDLSDGCACRCDGGPVQPRPYDDAGTCDYPDETCIDDQGYTADLVCSG